MPAVILPAVIPINSTSKDNLVEYDTKTINGIISLEKSKETIEATISKQVFLFLEKHYMSLVMLVFIEVQD